MPPVRCPKCRAVFRTESERPVCPKCKAVVALARRRPAPGPAPAPAGKAPAKPPRAARRTAVAPAKKNTLLYVIIGAVAVVAIGAAILLSMGGGPPPETGPKAPKYPETSALEKFFRRGETGYCVYKFAVDLGKDMRLLLLVVARPGSKFQPDDFALIDDAGARHVGKVISEAAPFDELRREVARGGESAIFEYRVPDAPLSLQVLEQGKPATTVPVHLPGGDKAGAASLDQEMEIEGWRLTPYARVLEGEEDFEVRVLFNGREAGPGAGMIMSDYFGLHAGEERYEAQVSHPLTAKKEMPKRYGADTRHYYRYESVPRKEKFLMQVSFRTLRPSYLVIEPSKLAERASAGTVTAPLPGVASSSKPKPGPAEPEKKPEPPKPKPAEKQEAPSVAGKAPLEALKILADAGGEEAAAEGLKVLTGGVPKEIDDALKAYGEGKWKEVEAHLLAAAKLSQPYSPDHSKALVRSVLTIRRELREGAADVLRGVAADAKGRRKEDAAKRIAAAKENKLFGGVFASELRDLEGKVSSWTSSAPDASAVDREIEKWTAKLADRRGGCPACRGAGEVACAKCAEKGFVEGPCARCSAAGSIDCALCEGKGKTDHHGYVGWVELELENDIHVTVKIGGKTRRGTLHAQTLRYDMSPCDGKGKFKLHAVSRPKGGEEKSDTFDQPCSKFWEEMKRFVFSGKAKIRVPGKGGQVQTYSPLAARRLFADYETCEGGRIPCDRCAGKKKKKCPRCGGAKEGPNPCETCSGGAHIACSGCSGFGETADLSWLPGLVKPGSVGILSDALGKHAKALEEWLSGRGKWRGHRLSLAQQLKEVLQDHDSKAEVEADFVRIPCPVCKGRGGKCEECWGSGKREYYEGTPQYEPYGEAAKLRAQLISYNPEEAGVIPAFSAKGAGSSPHAAIIGTAFKPPPDLTTLPPTPDGLTHLPEDIQNHIRTGVGYNQLGEKFFKESDSNVNPNGWVEKSYEAVAAYRKAQTSFATAQETLDARGIEVPKALMTLFRDNMKALFWARKHAP